MGAVVYVTNKLECLGWAGESESSAPEWKGAVCWRLDGEYGVFAILRVDPSSDDATGPIERIYVAAPEALGPLSKADISTNSRAVLSILPDRSRVAHVGDELTQIQLMATASCGIPDYTYEWSSQAASSVFSPNDESSSVSITLPDVDGRFTEGIRVVVNDKNETEAVACPNNCESHAMSSGK